MIIFPAQQTPSSMLSHRVYFDLIFALCFLVGVHGFSTLKILVILSLNYAIAKQLGASKALPAVTWIFNIGMLFLNEYFDGYRFAHIHEIAAPLVPFSARTQN
jgi:protein-cysteine N-palmitoyltransferase HHAT